MSPTNVYSILIDANKETQFPVSSCKDDIDDPEIIEEGVSKYEVQDWV